MRKDRRVILVADDDLGMRRFLEQALSRAGVQVVVVEDGLQALEAWAAGGISLLVTDYQMPGCTGTDVISKLRSSGDFTPVVLMSGTLGEEAIRISRDAGRVVCLPKPFGILELEDAVERVMASRAPAGGGEPGGPLPSPDPDHRR